MRETRRSRPAAGRLRRAVACAALVAFALLVPLVAGAQVGAEGAASPPEDFRGKVTLAYGVVIGLIVVFLVVSHRRNARLREEIAFLERRLDEIEKGRGG